MRFIFRSSALLPFICCLLIKTLHAQTDLDALTMNRGQFCGGTIYTHNQWDEYWEGPLKRTNLNMGTVTTRSVMAMGTYGLTTRLNLQAALPYVFTKASAGTLKGLKGVQDLSLSAKYRLWRKGDETNAFTLYGIAGASTPAGSYVADFLPMSIGLRSQTLFGRLLADYHRSRFFVTASASYHARRNIEIDREAYYTTEMHYTKEVEMPDAWYAHVRTGYRSSHLIAELVADRWTTLGGFDIRRNDMPFPSNRMNATHLGINIKFEPAAFRGFSLMAGGNETLGGRNVGKSTTLYGGMLYFFQLSKPSQPASKKQS